jgi:competence protein ComEC
VGSAVLALAVGWSVGIAGGWLFLLPGPVSSVAAIAALVAAGLVRSVGPRLLALGLAAALLGQARLAVDRAAEPFDPLPPFAGEVILTGRVVEAPLPRGRRVETVVEVDGIASASGSDTVSRLAEPGPRVLLRTATLAAGYGDRVRVRGRLSRPRSRPGWPLAEILRRRAISWVVDAGGARMIESGGPSPLRWLASARELFDANTRRVLPEPHASLVGGIVFGARAGLPPDLRAAMSATGTSHLTAVSGANVAMVAGALIVLTSRLVGSAPASLIAILGVWAYTLLVGAPPSALRAATMATLALAARGLGRQPDAIVGLAVAAALLLGLDPALAFDLGFQLSVAATAGLILLAPAIEDRLGRLPAVVRGQLGVALAAQLATLPLVVGTFQRVSLVAVPANVLAAPTIVPIMLLVANTVRDYSSPSAVS